MSKEKIEKYLYDAIIQESAILQQEELIATHEKISKWQKPVQRSEKAKPSPKWIKYELGGLAFLCAILLFVGFFVLFAGVMQINPIANAEWYYKLDLEKFQEGSRSIDKDDLANSLAEIQRMKKLKSILLTIGFLSVGSGLVFPVYKAYRNVQEKKEYRLSLCRYKDECRLIEKKNKEYEDEYRRELRQWNNSKEEISSFLHKSLAESENLLQRFYTQNVIYPKYQTLPALTRIYEYFITGRCEELTGPHGAYNLYEDELRKDTIISQLNIVIENLEQIKQNQYLLYQQVKAIQENTAAITYELQQIKGYTIQIA